MTLTGHVIILKLSAQTGLRLFFSHAVVSSPSNIVGLRLMASLKRPGFGGTDDDGKSTNCFLLRPSSLLPRDVSYHPELPDMALAKLWIEFIVDREFVRAYNKVREHLSCGLCGHQFAETDEFKGIMANVEDSPTRKGNFFICRKCDGPTRMLLKRRAMLEEKADRLRRMGL